MFSDKEIINQLTRIKLPSKTSHFLIKALLNPWFPQYQTYSYIGSVWSKLSSSIINQPEGASWPKPTWRQLHLLNRGEAHQPWQLKGLQNNASQILMCLQSTWGLVKMQIQLQEAWSRVWNSMSNKLLGDSEAASMWTSPRCKAAEFLSEGSIAVCMKSFRSRMLSSFQ